MLSILLPVHYTDSCRKNNRQFPILCAFSYNLWYNCRQIHKMQLFCLMQSSNNYKGAFAMATDRRTKYTKSVIREALFDLLKEKPLANGDKRAYNKRKSRSRASSVAKRDVVCKRKVKPAVSLRVRYYRALKWRTILSDLSKIFLGDFFYDLFAFNKCFRLCRNF